MFLVASIIILSPILLRDHIPIRVLCSSSFSPVAVAGLSWDWVLFVRQSPPPTPASSGDAPLECPLSLACCFLQSRTNRMHPTALIWYAVSLTDWFGSVSLSIHCFSFVSLASIVDSIKFPPPKTLPRVLFALPHPHMLL